MFTEDQMIDLMSKYIVFKTCMLAEKARLAKEGKLPASPGAMIQQEAYVQGVLECLATILDFIDRQYTIDQWDERIENQRKKDPIAWAKMIGCAEAFVKGNLPKIIH